MLKYYEISFKDCYDQFRLFDFFILEGQLYQVNGYLGGDYISAANIDWDDSLVKACINYNTDAMEDLQIGDNDDDVYA